MSNYTRTTDFASKDALPTGNAGKIIKGTEIGAEYDAIATAVASKLDASGATLSSPILSGLMTGTGIIDGGTY